MIHYNKTIMAKKSDFLKKISKTSIGVASIISSTTTIAISTGCADISQESEFPSFSLKCADATNNQMTYIDPVYGSPFPTQQ
ncbi:hypothetical protein FACS189496_4670 [Bacilli bacterium]|nr:hypothetical protein FACS189496_4670 [Bacilli bacterium]